MIMLAYRRPLIIVLLFSTSIALNSNIFNLFNKKSSTVVSKMSILNGNALPPIPQLQEQSKQTPFGSSFEEQEQLRLGGGGLPHTDAKLRLFGSTNESAVTFFRDTAAWCPYCQKVWILLEEKRIPYRVEKINMRSYGDKPPAFLRIVPNGLLPAIIVDGKVMTESLDIMLYLDRSYSGDNHPSMWPVESTPEYDRAVRLMRLERDLFGRWCNLLFRPGGGSGSSRKRFEEGLDAVNQELQITPGPWFLDQLSIVDLTYITHIERMCASVAYWSGFKIRGDGRWPAIERWLTAFETLPSYLATKSDYYTHVRDIPPQYGESYPVDGFEVMASRIDGSDRTSWTLPLPPFQPQTDIEPVEAAINPGEESVRHEAAYKLLKNIEAVAKFALRGAGSPGKKQFQAPLADPYAEPNLSYLEDMLTCLQLISTALLSGNSQELNPVITQKDARTIRDLCVSLGYLRDRIGVPRDMSYPAARQLRAHLNWLIDTLQQA